MQIMIDIPEEAYKGIQNAKICIGDSKWDNEDLTGLLLNAVCDGTPLTPTVLADALMEERIRGKLKQDISYSKDIIDDVKCILTVSIRDLRPCYCGSALRKVWTESEDKDADRVNN